MYRINKILDNKDFLEYISKNNKYEKDRVFCHHDLNHFLDVSRIMYILSLENKLGIEKEIIYACGLLHDIGRWQQYESGIPHEIASSNLAEDILINCGFNEDDIKIILEAIKNHRNKHNEKDSINGLLYRSDKLSRKCFDCPVEEECNWVKEKKNLNIQY